MRLLLVICLVAGLFIAGCSTASRPQKGREATVKIPAPPKKKADAADYSPGAVEERTESQSRFATALLHDFEDQPDAAANEFLKAAQANPKNDALVLEASLRLLQLKQTDRALDLLKKATAAPDASGALYAQLGMVYSLTGKKEEAIAADRAAIRKTPHLLAGYRQLVQIYVQNNQADEGFKVLEEAARQPGTDAGFLTDLGELFLIYSRTGTNDTARIRARETFQRALKENPTHPHILQKLGDGLAFLGESDKATQCYLKLLEAYPQLPGLREKLAEIYLRTQDKTNAAQQLRAIIRADPTNPQAYYFLGSIAYENRQMQEAADNYSKVILLNPNFEPAYYDLAGALINLNKAEDALAMLNKARARFKENFVCEFFTALAYNRLKQYSNALKFFTAAEIVAGATDTNRLNHLFYFQVGAAYERNQQFDEAEKNFRKSLQMSPDFGEALNYLGYMWAERGERLEEAHDMIARAVKQEPKNAAFLDSLGWVLYKLNQPEKALPHLLKSIEYTEEPDATLQEHLGDVYFALKQFDKAREAWRKSLSIEPNENKEKIQKKLDALPKSSAPDSAAPK